MLGKSGLNSQKLDDCMYRLNRLESTVTEPFFMEIFRLNQDGEKLSVEDLTQIFLITENYLFRRNICDVTTNALNKIFVNLNREVIRYDNRQSFHRHWLIKQYIKCVVNIMLIYLNVLRIMVLWSRKYLDVILPILEERSCNHDVKNSIKS